MRNYETKFFDYIDKKTGGHVVKATTLYAGKIVSAFSKCDPNDKFDLEFGKAVASKRLDIKINQKRYASMLAYAKFCKQNLEFLEQEKKRIQRAMERAEIAGLDRKVELKELEAELAELLATTN